VRRHDLDLVSLITGVVFALVAAAHLVGAATGDALDPLWLAPVLLIGLGVAGLAGALRSSGQADGPAAVEDGTTTG
jgi:hypothetical protein